MKKLLAILFLLTAGISNAQSIKVQGIVTDSLEMPIEMANVMAMNLEQDKMDGYSITGEEGQYLLHLKPNTRYQLKISYLGFTPKTVDITTKEENMSLPVVLEGGSTLLDEIEIVHQMPVSIKGDTIVYNADSFTSGTERKLIDILKKMPGFEVDREGNVKILGKPIKKVMIEDKDFFGGSTRFGVMNIPADAVDKVEVLRNYNENDQLRPVTNNENSVAMNIKLKENKKNFWFGDITAGTGVAHEEGRYLVNPKLFYYSNNYSLGFIANLNNIGEQAMAFSDFSRMTGGLGRQSGKHGTGTRFNTSGSSADISTSRDNKATEITNRAGAINFGYHPTKKFTVSGVGIIADNKTDRETWNRTQNLNTDTGEVITTEERAGINHSITEMAMLKLTSKYKPNTKITFDYDILFKKAQQRNDNSLMTQVTPHTAQSQDISTTNKQDPFSLNQNISVSYAPNSRHVFAFETQHLYQDENPFFNADLAQRPFDFAGYMDGQLRQNIVQERFLKTNKVDSRLDYFYEMNNKNHINIILGNTYSYQNFNSHIFQILDSGTQNDLDAPELNNRVSFAFNDLYLSANYKFITGKFTFNPGLTAHYYSMNDTQLGSSNERSFARVLPRLEVNYKIRSSKRLNYSFSFQNHFTDIARLAEGYLFQGYNSLFQGNRNLENAVHQTHSINYSSLNSFTMQNFSIGINYSQRANNMNSIVQFDGINRSSTLFNSNFADESLSGSVNFGKTVARYFKTHARAYLTWSKQNIMQSNPANNIVSANAREAFSQNYLTGVRTSFEEFPNVEVEYAIMINENPEETFYTSSPKINLDYYFLDGFALTADYTFNNYYNKSRTVDNQFDFLNASLAYMKKESSWEYRLSATNILNTKTLNSDNFTPFSILTTQTWVLPRYVVFSLRYNL